MPDIEETYRLRIQELERENAALRRQRDQERHQAPVYRQQMMDIGEQLAALQKKYDAIAWATALQMKGA